MMCVYIYMLWLLSKQFEVIVGAAEASGNS
jgi:hypothetical protein